VPDNHAERKRCRSGSGHQVSDAALLHESLNACPVPRIGGSGIFDQCSVKLTRRTWRDPSISDPVLFAGVGWMGALVFVRDKRGSFRVAKRKGLCGHRIVDSSSEGANSRLHRLQPVERTTPGQYKNMLGNCLGGSSQRITNPTSSGRWSLLQVNARIKHSWSA